MANMTYPARHPQGNLSTDQLQAILANPKVIATRIANLANMRFMSDFLLTAKLNATGGGIFYETGEELFPTDKAKIIAPGGEYPMTMLEYGNMAAARVEKFGLGTTITDEKLAREGQSYLDRAMGRIVNGLIRDVDSVSMAVVTSKVNTSFSSPKEWTKAGQVFEALTTAQSERAALATGLNLDTVVMKTSQWAEMIGMFVDQGILAREDANVVTAGRVPVNLLGYWWSESPFYTNDLPMLVDRDNLGGMADEDLRSPGWTNAGDQGIQTISDRKTDTDAWDIRSRRNTVAVVLDSNAGVYIEGTGL